MNYFLNYGKEYLFEKIDNKSEDLEEKELEVHALTLCNY